MFAVKYIQKNSIVYPCVYRVKSIEGRGGLEEAAKESNR